MQVWDYEVFLSHNSRDKPAVEALARRFLEAGVKPWLDKWDLVPGEDWLPAIEGAMRASPAIAICVGPSGFGKVHHTELQAALNATYADEGKRVLPVLLPGSAEGGADVPDFLQLKTWIDYRREDDEAFDRMVKAIRGERPGPRAPDTSECPYRGLEPFRPEHARFFYGREQEVAGLLEALQEGDRLLLLVGASGSGKSSMVLAGVVPAVQSGQLDGTYGWRVVSLKPGSDPCRSLARALLEITRQGDQAAAVTDVLAHSGGNPGAGGVLGLRAASSLVEAVQAFQAQSAQLEDLDQGRTLLQRLDRALRRTLQELDGESGEAGGLARELSQVDQLRQLLMHRPEAFTDGATASLDEETSLLLVVDQFEELFTLTRDANQRDAFLEAILHAVRAPDSRIHAIITARADFLAKFLGDPLVAPIVQSSMRVAVSVMDKQQIERAIRGPAGQVGLRVEDAVVDALVEGVAGEPGDLPLLQFTLYELWLRRQGGKITWEAYTELGGLKGAIAQRAESVYEEVGGGETGDHDQRLLRRIFGRLVQLGEGTEDTRRRASRAELHTLDPDHAEALVDRLVTARLLTAGAEDVEVAHEAVIREWGRLRQWIDQDRESLRLRQDLGQGERLWSEGGRANSDLWRGGRLERALELQATGELHLAGDELEFLKASRREREAVERRKEEQRQQALKTARIMRVLGLSALVMAVLASALGAWAWFAKQDAEHKRQLAADVALLARARSTLHSGDAPTAALLALNLENPEALWTATGAMDSPGVLLEILGHRMPFLELRGDVDIALFSPTDPDRLLVVDDLGTRLLDVSGAGEPLALSGAERTPYHAWFSPDGQSLLAGTFSGSFLYWNLDEPTAPVELPGVTYSPMRRPSVAWSTSGERLLLLQEGSAFVWRLAAPRPVLELEVEPAVGLTSAWFDSGGDQLLGYSSAGALRSWPLASPGEVTLLGEALGELLAVGPDGDRFVTRADQLIVHRLGSDSFPLAVPPELASETEGMLLSRGGHYLVCRAPRLNDHGVFFWLLQPGRTPEVLQHASRVVNMHFDPNGQQLAVITANSGVSVHRFGVPASSIVLRGEPGICDDVSFSADGRRLATHPPSSPTRVWDLGAHNPSIWPGPAGDAISPGVRVVLDDPVQFSPAGDQVVVTFEEGVELIAFDGATTSYPLSEDHEFRGFSPDGSAFLVTDAEGAAQIGRVTGDRLMFSQPRDSAHLWWPRGYLSSSLRVDEAGGDGTLHLTDGEGVLATSRAAGDRVVTNGADGESARVWFLDGSQPPLDLPTGEPEAAAFSPDGKLLVTVDSSATARAWSLVPPNRFVELPPEPGQELRLDGVSFCPRSLGSLDNQHLVAVSDSLSHDARVFLLGGPQGQPLLLAQTTLTELTAKTVRVVFNTRGDRVMTLNGKEGDLSARVYRLELNTSGLRATAGTELVSETRFATGAFLDDDTVGTVDVHGRIRRWPFQIEVMTREIDDQLCFGLPPTARMILFDEDADTAWDSYEAHERADGRTPRPRPTGD